MEALGSDAGSFFYQETRTQMGIFYCVFAIVPIWVWQESLDHGNFAL